MSQGWRGIVGLVKPTYRVGSLEELIRLLPDGIGVIPLYVGIRAGTEEEFVQALKIAEQKADELASVGVDLIQIGGAPPAMLLGYDGDHKFAERLSQKYGIPVTLSTTSLVKALRALSIKKMIGLTYFKEELNQKFSKYLTDAGFQVLAMEGIDWPFKDVGKIPATEVYAFAKKTFLKVGGADGIYFLGNGWRILPIVEKLEQDLQTTVIATEQTGLWDILTTLKVKEPIKGCGKLLTDMV